LNYAIPYPPCRRIRKGEILLIPILVLNRSKSMWGEDAMEFKCVLFSAEDVLKTEFVSRPERWESVPEAVSSIPGVWGNILSFLGGPRSCIGYRFSLME
jgi:cytochrome P450